MLHRIICIFLLGISLSSQSQSFQIDTTFQPFFDIRDQRGARINDVYENPPDGRVYLAGNFRSHNGQTQYKGSVCYFRDGELFTSYKSYIGLGTFQSIIRLNKDTFFIANGSNAFLIDSLGDTNGTKWRINALKSVRCATGTPYFFPDGSSLFGNSSDNSGDPCDIGFPDSTNPGSHIMKLTPEGLWDSTFSVTSSRNPRGFFRYDNNRIIVYGNPKDFKTYNGVQIDGMCRIFLDGTLDTSFHSPLVDTSVRSVAVPTQAQEDGSFFIRGGFLLKGNNNYQTLAKLNSDGSLDSSFMNLSGATDTIYRFADIYAMAPTDDGGFIVAGRFSHYQGVVKNAIAKIDRNGRLQPQFFSSVGPDSAKFISGNYTVPTINIILKSKFGGYYVGGNFLTWDGKPSQPIVRLTGLDSADLVDTSTSVREISQANSQVKLYPNPTNGKVFLISNEIISEINVLNAVGQLIQTFQPHSNRFDWALPEPKGIYFIKLLDKNGNLKSKIIINQ